MIVAKPVRAFVVVWDPCDAMDPCVRPPWPGTPTAVCKFTTYC